MLAILFFSEHKIAQKKLLFFVDKVLTFAKAFNNKLMALGTLINVTNIVYFMLAKRVLVAVKRNSPVVVSKCEVAS